MLRNVSSVQVTRCVISGCSSAVLLSSSYARLTARDTHFVNARNVIEVIRGGHIHVQHCKFEIGSNDVGMRIAADTAGVVCHNRVCGEGSIWGRVEPPVGVQHDLVLGPADLAEAELAAADEAILDVAGA